jgi:hypothetical protein
MLQKGPIAFTYEGTVHNSTLSHPVSNLYAIVLKELGGVKGQTRKYAAETSIHGSDTPEHDSVAI